MADLNWMQTSESLTATSAPVDEIIFPRDPMFSGDARQYLRIGRAALRCVRLALLAGRAQPPKVILDLPSGFGRILRHLQAAYPNSELVACDIRPDAVAFCEKTFGVRGVLGNTDPDLINLPSNHFDIIWCQSLLTHIDILEIEKFLKFFERILKPKGIAAFTTTGRLVAEGRVRNGSAPLTFTPEQAKQVLADYDATGYGSAETLSTKQSAFRPKYGDCLISPAWMCAKLNDIVPSMQLLLYTEGGMGPRSSWAQDCIAVQKQH